MLIEIIFYFYHIGMVNDRRKLIFNLMSNAILHSSQYQEYRRIDLIVIHCSATRASRSYTVSGALPTLAITTTLRAMAWFTRVAPSTRRGRMPAVITNIPSASVTRVGWMSMAALPIHAHPNSAIVWSCY